MLLEDMFYGWDRSVELRKNNTKKEQNEKQTEMERDVAGWISGNTSECKS